MEKKSLSLDQVDSSFRKPKSHLLIEDIPEGNGETTQPIITKGPTDIIKDTSDTMNDWHLINKDATIRWNGVVTDINSISAYVKKTCLIPQDAGLSQIRALETTIGNLIAMIYIEKSMSSYALGALEAQRLKQVGRGMDAKGRRSISATEAYMAAHDDEYQTLQKLITNCKLSNDFLNDMYNICLRSVDRLKQISMSLMAEMKIEPSDSGGRGQAIRGGKWS